MESKRLILKKQIDSIIYQNSLNEILRNTINEEMQKRFVEKYEENILDIDGTIND